MVSVKFWYLHVKNNSLRLLSILHRLHMFCRARWLRGQAVCVMLLVSLSVLPGSAVAGDSLANLQSLLRATASGEMAFTQTVTAPAKANRTKRKNAVSNGTMRFFRPGKFRFDYTQPFAQSIVGDGATLWLWDPDLNQVTARNQQAALGNTPAALVVSNGDLTALSVHYTLTARPDQGGLQWVEAIPKLVDGSLQSVRVGFDRQQLRALVMLDNFGQTSDMRFDRLRALPPEAVDAAFRFTPPPGADVIRP
jgi:outer membrane lipoprotein carrier protein